MHYSDINKVLAELKKSQEADEDRRDKVREINHFLNDPDGQWEPGIWKRLDGRPRYTFDMCNPVVANIWGEMAQNDFDIRIKPAGGEATKETAKIMDGLIRNIETMSDASEIYASAGKKAIRTGFAAWRVYQDWADVDSFDQDLFIKEINNAVDRVWFDAAAEKPTMEDARFCFELHTMSKEEFEEKYPEASGISVGQGRDTSTYYHKADKVVIGEFLYKKPMTKTLYLMNNGEVYNEEDMQLGLQAGLTVQRERKRDVHVVMSRKFDGTNWLEEPKETVFSYLPIIPVYANFEIIEDKVIYWGAVEHLMDSQRVYNYSESRKVEEVALAPRPKLMMTKKQAAGNESTLRTMNTNSDPVQFYNPDPEAPQPYQVGGPQMNPGLSEVSQNMATNIERSSGVFGVNPTNNKGLQSNVALERLENRGQIGTFEYFKAQERAICHTAKVLMKAIPKVYDAERTQRIMNEDGSFEMAQLNTVVLDQRTGQYVMLNDLSRGIYDATCDVGPAFQNRQQESVKAILDLGAIDPSIIAEGGDILLNNINAPSIDQLAARRRRNMVLQGVIPEDQLTDEELEMVQAINQQPKEPSPADLIAEAEVAKTQNEAAKIESDIILQAQKQEAHEAVEFAKLQMQQNEQVIDMLKTMSETLENLRNATGADAVMTPEVIEAYAQQAEMIADAQEGLDRIE